MIRIGSTIHRTFPRFGKRRINGKVTRAVIDTVIRQGVVEALETVEGQPMARIRYVGGAVNWEPIEMLRVVP